MNEIRYSKVFVVLCCLALHIATLSAQNDSVRFFNEVDTSFCKVHVGQDVPVGYYSTREIYDMSVPRWDDCEAELVSGPHSTRSSRTSFVNGKQENLSLHGNYYIVRFKKAGWVTLPSVRAMTGGKMRTCSTMKVCVLPAENIEEVVCSVSTEPETLRPGEVFKFVLTCNRHPDESKPELEHPGIRQLSFSTRYSKKDGKEEYAFVYRMEVVRSGSNIIRVRKLTFGGTDYPIKPFLLKIDGETYL